MNRQEIYLAGGCFWGIEHFLKQVAGVLDTETGFANGHTPNPTYEQVYTDTTGYAETVKVTFDADVAPLDFLVDMYFHAIDPTSINRQGEDSGTRYRTGIYYTQPGQLPVIRQVMQRWQQHLDGHIAVEVEPLRCFTAASERHQDYLDKNPQGYCHLPLELFAWAKRQHPSVSQS